MSTSLDFENGEEMNTVSEENVEAVSEEKAEETAKTEAEEKVETETVAEEETPVVQAEAEEEPDEDSEEEADEDDGKSDKSFSARRSKKKIEALKNQVKELEDIKKRQLAEFTNFRKRTENEKSQMFELGAKSVIEKILPVVDSFERGLSQVPETEEAKSFVEGMELIYKQLMKSFEEMGVKAIDACGKEFNPDLHNAVMAVDDDSLESGTVAEELQKGYTYKDSVVRHSMVKVVN
ncbi:MAG: nucleotide exchange factor GrpE [Lachnospiraceae bacterium]|nr:nucleotide exchange factor GrpE [Lachnospiraceae bacterium]